MFADRGALRGMGGGLLAGLLFAGLAAGSFAQTATSDRAALVALYEAAGGDDWADETNWLSAEPLAAWHGVTTDRDGRVTLLSLHDNGLRVRISPELARLTKSTGLFLSRNALSGEIPPEVGSLAKLTTLFLSANRFSGEIPPALGNLTNLREIDLSHNALTGKVPAALGNLSKLASLNLSRNALSGGIASELTGLTSLIALDLSGNDLTGSIPAGMARLADLWQLKLNSTLLAGPIPDGLGDLPNLELLELAFNERLTGSVPSRLREAPPTRLDLMGTPVCVPPDAVFQAWSRTIEDFRSPGLTCGEPVPALSTVDLAVFFARTGRIGLRTATWIGVHSIRTPPRRHAGSRSWPTTTNAATQTWSAGSCCASPTRAGLTRATRSACPARRRRSTWADRPMPSAF